MKISHWSVRYQALQQFDPLTRVKRNLRPLQVQAALMNPKTRAGRLPATKDNLSVTGE